MGLLFALLLVVQAPAACADAAACRADAEAAAARGEFETFHDLAWRTIQTGNAKDPELLYLLARAQSLSGRPHDALVVLQRLVTMGVATDAATNDDFKRTREYQRRHDPIPRISLSDELPYPQHDKDKQRA